MRFATLVLVLVRFFTVLCNFTFSYRILAPQCALTTTESGMKGATAREFGDVNEVLSVSTDCARPVVDSGSKKMLLRVKACSLSPGDCRMISGDCEIIKKPTAFPYIPGLDVCGVVEEVDPAGGQDSDGSKFKIGDCVVGTWDIFGVGGLAEFALVDTKLAVLKPASLNEVEGAAMANSPTHAMLAVRAAKIKAGDRVLVLGGSGGVGTSVVQLVRHAGASFVASTSTDEPLLKSLGVDVVIDYREKNWWDAPELYGGGGGQQPFDVIIDCAEGRRAWKRAQNKSVLKSGWNGGRFVAVVLNDWHIVGHSYWDLFGKFFLPVVGRTLWSRVCFPFVPKYIMFIGSVDGDLMSEISGLVEEGRLKIVLDPSSPFPLTIDGVRQAFCLQQSRHAHGKVVVKIDSES